KPFEVETNRILIRGETASAAPVTLLTVRLQELPLQRLVQLLSLSRDRNDRYQFEIELRL
ncbi:MAG: hypothetical protein LUD68_01100, partial [Rikenellaceae bacterium]|nr:hypothetical protein [Rikenellaceae bacterium]